MTTDAGTALERTRLAWRRTVLAATVVAVLCARLAISTAPAPLAAVSVAAAATGWLAVVALAQRRSKRLTSPPTTSLPLIVMLILGYVAMSAILVLRSG